MNISNVSIKKLIKNYSCSLKSFFYFFLFFLSFSVLLLGECIPSGQSPDEYSHLCRAYSLIKGDWFLKDNGSGVGSMINKGLIEYIGTYSSLYPNNKVTDKKYEDARKIKFNDDYVYISYPTHALYFPITYLPQAIAFFIGEKTHQKVYKSLRLAKFLCVFSIAIMLFFANKIYPIPFSVFFVLFLPMCLFQIASPTSDGLHYGMTILIMSLFYALYQFGFDVKKLVIFSCLLFIIGSHRISLAPLVVLLLVLYSKERKKEYLLCFLIISTLILGWVFFAMQQFSNTQKTDGLMPIAFYYLTHLQETLSIFSNTIFSTKTIINWLDSFIGILGWLDYRMSKAFYYFSYLVLLTVFISSIKKKIYLYDIFISIFSLLIIFITLFLLLIQWTDFPHPKEIAGFQGRYCIYPVIILLYALCRNDRSYNKLSLTKVTFITVWGFVSVFDLFVNTISRYYI